MKSLLADEVTARTARESLLLGLEATGNMMGWIDPQQPAEFAAENMRRLGQMIEILCVVISDLNVAIENPRSGEVTKL